MKILLVEDDLDLAELIMEYLETENMHCENAATGRVGLKLAQEQWYDCMILDLNLPLMDGIAVCRALRGEGCQIPIIILTARSSIEEKLEGFASGADDYLCKPFEMRELIAKIKAVTQRNYHMARMQCGDLKLDMQKKIVMRGKAEVQLSKIEWKILHLLLINSPNPVHKNKLINEVWGDSPPQTNSLKVHIHNLRKAIHDFSNNQLIHTISGSYYAIFSK